MLDAVFLNNNYGIIKLLIQLGLLSEAPLSTSPIGSIFSSSGR